MSSPYDTITAMQNRIKELEEFKSNLLVYAEVGSLGDPEVTINATFGEVFSIVSKLVETLSNSTDGKVTYNQILNDLKEV